MNKPFINSVVVVEGKHDVSRICEVFDVLDFVLTNGYAINSQDIDYLTMVSKYYRVIVLTDSDKAGEQIRKQLNSQIEHLINIKVDITKCNHKNKHGVAECNKDEIYKTLSPYIEQNTICEEITYTEMFENGIIGNINSKAEREKIIKMYHLGVCNNKTFIKRYNILKKYL